MATSTSTSVRASGLRPKALPSGVLAALFSSLLLGAAPAGPVGMGGPDGVSPVADAAQRGDTDGVRALLKEGADVNAAQADGMTALHWAAREDNVAMAKVLVYAGADLESITRLGGYTPLHLAAREGHAAVIQALLDAGAKVDDRTSTGVTALHFAAANGSPEAVEVLLDHGADSNARETASSQTPLMFATAEDRIPAIQVLLKHGADVSLTSAVVDYAERAREDVPEQRRRDKLVEARREADAEAAGGPKEDEGARARAPGTGATSPTRSTGTVADRSAAQLQSREEPEEPDAPKGASPPRIIPGVGAPTGGAPPAAGDSAAAKGAAGDTAAAKPPAGPRPYSYADLVGKQGGMSALHYAARDGHVDVVEALLAAGADVNEPTAGDQSTPLLIATINGNYDLAMVLLDDGADPKLASDAGATPLFTTLNNRWAPKAFYPQPTAFKQQKASYLDLMKALLEHGADPNVRLKKHLWYTSYNFDLLGVDFMGATPFWRAAYSLDVPAMKLLVAHGADPNIPTLKPPRRRRGGQRGGGGFGRPGGDDKKADPSGLPPVPVGGPGVYPIQAASGVGYGQTRAGNAHRHVPNGWLPAVKYLVEELGVDVNARDFQGFTPVHDAAARGDNELIEYLVSKGADVTLVARTGQTTVDMANGPQQRVQPFPETIALLEKLGAKNNHHCVSCD